jgi:uncharacterized membrane protein (UPF0182 family)
MVCNSSNTQQTLFSYSTVGWALLCAALYHYHLFCYWIRRYELPTHQVTYSGESCVSQFLAIQFWTVSVWFVSVAISVNLLACIFFRPDKKSIERLQYALYSLVLGVPLLITIIVGSASVEFNVDGLRGR